MQPLFEASGWALPKSIAKETKKSKKQISDNQSHVGNSTQGADQLQAQLSSLTAPKKNEKKRSLEQDDKKKEAPQTKKAKQKKNNRSEEKKNVPESKKDKEIKKEVKKNTPEKKADDDKAKENKQSKKQKLQKLLAKKNESKPSQKASDEKANKQVPSQKVIKKATSKSAFIEKEDDLDADLTPLQRKMKEKLSGARFRWLNEQLYTTSGNKSFKLFQEKPELFDEYHEGFRHQVESWPVNPVDVIVEQLKQLPKNTVIADLGCGDAMIAQSLEKYNVLSYDLIAKNERVIACDISKLPLEDSSIDVAVFSLSLMGTNYVDFLKEAHRVLKVGGELKIAEVVSRFSDIDTFIALLEELGFDFMDKEDDNKMFVMMYFTKQPNYEEAEDEMLSGLSKTQKRSLKKGAGINTSKNKLQKKSQQLLKPCLYKKR